MLAKTLTLMAPLLFDDKRYGAIVSAVDQRVAEVAGDSAAAEHCRDRAMALLRSGHTLQALAELHTAKVNWWTGDTLRGALLCMLIIAQCYENLGLTDASRYYALVAANAAMAHTGPDHLDLAAAGMIQAAHLDHEVGSWLTATAERDLAAKLHIVAHEDGDNMDTYPTLKQVAYEQMLSLAYAERFLPSVAAAIRSHMGDTWLLSVHEFMETEGALPSWPLEERRTLSRGQLGHAPFAELAQARCIRWRALGLDWRVHFENTVTARLAAERLAAVGQIVCAEMALDDACLLQTVIDIELEVATDLELDARVQPLPSNDGRRWAVALTPWDGSSEPSLEDATLEALAVLYTVLGEGSLLPDEPFRELMSQAFERGLLNKAPVGRLYDELRAEFVVEPPALTASELAHAGDQAIPEPPENVALAWRSDPGPGYSLELSQQHIRERYAETARRLPITLARLRDDPDFCAVVAELRSRGFHDWHILTGVFNVTWNFRLVELGLANYSAFDDTQEQIIQQLVAEPETADLPEVPASELSAEAISSGIRGLDVADHEAMGSDDSPTHPGYARHRPVLRYPLHVLDRRRRARGSVCAAH